MNSRDIVRQVHEEYHKRIKCNPKKDINDVNRGINAILFYLYNNQDSVITPGLLAEVTKVSTARIAKLLNKMEEKNLIKRQIASDDKRRIIVKLTDKGISLRNEKYQKFEDKLVYIIDSIGQEEFLKFSETFFKIIDLIEGEDEFKC